MPHRGVFVSEAVIKRSDYWKGDAVYAWFWNDWFPGTVYLIDEDCVHVLWDEVDWDGEATQSRLPRDWVVSMYEIYESVVVIDDESMTA